MVHLEYFRRCRGSTVVNFSSLHVVLLIPVSLSEKKRKEKKNHLADVCKTLIHAEPSPVEAKILVKLDVASGLSLTAGLS